MDIKLFLSTFFMIFLAEMGDKTQIMAMSASANDPKATVTIGIAVALALALSGLIGVIAGRFLSGVLTEQNVRLLSGTVFLIFTIITFSRYFMNR